MWRRRLDNLIKALGKNLSPLESVKIKKPPIQGMGRDQKGNTLAERHGKLLMET